MEDFDFDFDFDYDFDFGEGGAFPEILMAQYPLEMGKKNSKSGANILALRVDSEGNVGFDAVVRQQGNATKIVYSQPKDLEPGVTKDGFDETDVDEEDRQREIENTMVATKAVLDEIVNANVTRPENVSKFGTDKAFTGTSEKDPFELDQFIQPMIEVKKNEENMDKVADGGTMRASKRRRISFQR